MNDRNIEMTPELERQLMEQRDALCARAGIPTSHVDLMGHAFQFAFVGDGAPALLEGTITARCFQPPVADAEQDDPGLILEISCDYYAIQSCKMFLVYMDVESAWLLFIQPNAGSAPRKARSFAGRLTIA